jgi:ribosomal-protein-alanine N-acetyltransferase
MVSVIGAAVSIAIERMSEHDLLEIVEIEEASGLSPWGWDSYHKELSAGNEAIMLVARAAGVVKSRADGRRIAGFIVSRMAADELHVNNVAVRPDCRRFGVATRLLEATFTIAAAKGVSRAFLEVRASNRVARKLYQGCGFRTIGRRRGYYRAPSEDALIMSVLVKRSA